MTTGVRPISAGAGEIPPNNISVRPTSSATTPMGTSRLPRRLQTHKPLPSPPIAQVVNPDTPPKAQRTLVDAYSGSLKGKNWPIIHPENVPLRLSSKRNSLPASSNIDSIPVSSFDGASDDDSVRVRRLSCHSSSSAASTGTGPVLKISADADAVILGTAESIPAVPAIPKLIPERPSHQRSLGALRNRVSKATEPKTSPSITPPSQTAWPTGRMRDVSSGVKISPIRSMQPPRKLSLDGYSPKSPSPLAQPCVDTKITDQASAAVSDIKADTAKDSDDSTKPTAPVRESKPTISSPTAAAKLFKRSVEAGWESTETYSGSFAAPKDEQVLDIKKIRKTITTTVSSTPPVDLDDRSSNEDKSWKATPFDQGSSSLSYTTHSYDTVRNLDFYKTRATETATSKAAHSSLGYETPNWPQSDHSDEQLIESPATPSPLEGMPSDKKDQSTTEKKIKAQRSIRDIFNRNKSRVNLIETPSPKQGFISATRSSLAKVMRDPRNRSKAHVTKQPDPPMPLTAFKFAGTSASPTRQLVPDNRETTRAVVLDMLDRLEGEPRDSSRRLRDTQIAECVINAAECARNAEWCALEAKKNSRDAEIHADRAGLELMRVYGLLEGAGLDAEFVSTVKALIRQIVTYGKPEAY